MLNGTKKLFPTEYNNFKEAMIKASMEGNLPVSLQLNEIKDYTLKDFEETFSEFQSDTGLDISGTFFMCTECNALHVLIEVDYPDIDENIPIQ